MTLLSSRSLPQRFSLVSAIELYVVLPRSTMVLSSSGWLHYDSAVALIGPAMFLHFAAAHLFRLARGSTSVLSCFFLDFGSASCCVR